MLAVRRIDDHTLSFRFRVTRTASDTGLFEAYGFSHFDNMDSTPRKLAYKGKKYLIYNETSNCVKSYEGSLDKYVLRSCTELDGEDPALNVWETLYETDDIMKHANETDVRKTATHNYIYCFPGNVTIEGQTYRCPIETFRLKVNKRFRLYDVSWSGSPVESLDSNQRWAIDTVHSSHFRDDSDTIQHLALFDALKEERNAKRKLLEELGSGVHIKYSSPTLWILILTLIAPLVGGCVFFISKYLICKAVATGVESLAMNERGRSNAPKAGTSAPLEINENRLASEIVSRLTNASVGEALLPKPPAYPSQPNPFLPYK